MGLPANALTRAPLLLLWFSGSWRSCKDSANGASVPNCFCRLCQTRWRTTTVISNRRTISSLSC